MLVAAMDAVVRLFDATANAVRPIVRGVSDRFRGGVDDIDEVFCVRRDVNL